jgi:hypothetical protein
VFSLVERGGKVRSTHVQHVNGETLGVVMSEQLHRASYLMTDEARQYWPLGRRYAEHTRATSGSHHEVLLDENRSGELGLRMT